MKIFVNLDNQPPSLASSLSTRSATAANAVLSYSVSGSVSSFEFKRGTTVPLEIVLAGTNVPDAAEISALKFALKPSGKYDTATFHEKRGTFGGVRGHLEIFAKAGLQRAQVAMKKAAERKLTVECAKITRKNARASK